MARVDVSDLLLDPDFQDSIQIVRRLSSVNEYGEMEMVERCRAASAVVQGNEIENLDRLPEGARLSDIITVYYRGKLYPERPGGYADVVLWAGNRYQVRDVTENYMNWGAGWTKARCFMEEVNAD